MFDHVPDKPLGCMPTALCIYVTKKSLTEKDQDTGCKTAMSCNQTPSPIFV